MRAGGQESKGQVSIPAEVRERLGLRSHTEVEFRLAGNGVVVTTVAAARATSPIDGPPASHDLRWMLPSSVRTALLLAILPCVAAAQRHTAPSRFQRLLDDHWRWTLSQRPMLATTLGEHRYDAQLGDLSVAAMDRRAQQTTVFLARADQLDTLGLTPMERVTRAILRRDLATDIEGNRFGQRTVLFTTYAGWHTGFADIGEHHPFRDRADYAAYVARLAAYPQYNRQGIETTRAALAGGFAQPCTPFVGYERTISGVMDSLPERSRFLAPFARRPAYFTEAEWTALRGRAVAAVRDSVYPAYQALLDFYMKEYRPRCRATDGVSATPGGAAYFAYRVRLETTTDLTPEQIHQLGLREVARIGAEMDSLARRAGYVDRKAFVAHLRADPQYYARSPAELLAAASVLTKHIDGEMPKLFGHLPRLPYTVKPIPDAIAPGTTTAYYGPGSLEGGRAGTYWVNTSKLDQRPLYELPALTMHESVPGHHQQIAIGQELDLPPFRRYGVSFAAFTEGWGLYAERLGIEMGMYDTPEKQMGRLSYEMWRACRLVVDPGIHAKGWTREQAIAYMLDQTALSRANIEAEVNRYITWPGQATAYKVGELRIRELRTRAEERLGARFDLRGFHDAVLENGAVPLDVMAANVERWISRSARAAAIPTSTP
jgi:AbrB family looped-hinge helix DNA binding protein